MTNESSQPSNGRRSARRLTPEQLEERRSRNRERIAQRRANETPERREARLLANRERNRARRQTTETTEQRAARLGAMRESNRASRQSEPPAKRQRRLETDLLGHQVRRATDDESIVAARQEDDRANARRRRELEDTPIREACQSADRAATRNARALEDTPVRETRQHTNRTAIQIARALEDTPTHAARQRANRAAMQLARASEKTPTRSARQRSDREAVHAARALENTPEQTARRETIRQSTQRSRASQDTPARSARRQANRSAMREARRLESTPRIEVRRTADRDARRASRDTTSTRFRKHIRADNTALCMASVAAKWVARGPGRSNFNPTITIQGRIYHYMGPLLAAETRSPAFLSVYIHDTDYAEQTRTRMGMFSELNEQILIDLTRMLHEGNPYVNTFRSLREWAHEDNSPTPYHMVILADRRPAGEHVRRHNGPEASEVAALIPGNEDGAIARRDIVVRRRGVLNTNGTEALDSISVSHRSYDAPSYVLLFPDGRDGWYPELRLNQVRGTRTKVTPLMFYSWQLFQRSTEFSTILHACRLFQQYLVDQYCKVEAERLSYIRRNQQRLRAADYTHLQEQLGDAGSAEDEAEAVRAGRLFILPSTYIGGDRYMRQQMHDIIAISNKVGHPDIFLTITCNPNWEEILNALLPGQTPRDRPDLCARVFKLKLQAMMSTVIDNKLFGIVVAHVRVIEFQKTGHTACPRHLLPR